MGIFSIFKKKQYQENLRQISPYAWNMVKGGQVLKRNTEASIWSSFAEAISESATVSTQLASYSKNVINYACTYAIANTIASLPTKLFNYDKDGNEVVVNNNEYADKMLQYPNPNWSWYDFIEGISTLLELTGFAVIENVLPKSPKELWPMRSDLVEMKIGEYGISKFIYNVNGKRITFSSEKDEAFIIKYFNPTNFNTGFSPYDPMKKQMAIDYFTLQFVEGFFKSDGHIGGILKLPVPLPKQKKDELYSQLEERMGSASKSFRALILDGDKEWIQTQVNPQSANVDVFREMTRGDIITAHGCYPIVLGFLDGASYANANIQWKLFYRNTIKPKAQKIEESLNKHVFNKYGVYFKFDFTTIPELREDEKEKSITAMQYKKSGVLTINEIRARLNLGEDIEGGDELPQEAPISPFGKSAEDRIIKAIKKKAHTYAHLTG